MFLNLNFLFTKVVMSESTENSLKNSPLVQKIRRRVESFVPSQTIDLKETGIITLVGDGIVVANGLKSVACGELVQFSTQEVGIVLNLESKRVKIVVFGNGFHLKPGQLVTRLKVLAGISVSLLKLGRVVDALGNFIDGRAAYSFD